MFKQDEFVAQLAQIAQQPTPCADSCKDCKCRVKGEVFGTDCVHLIINRIVEELIQ